MFTLVIGGKPKKPGDKSPFARELLDDYNKSKGSESEDGEMDTGTGAGLEAAQAFLDAIDAKDPKALWSAYQDMCMAHERGGAEPEEDEESSEGE